MKVDGNYCGRLQPIASSRRFPGSLCFWLAVVTTFLASDRLESAVIHVQPSPADAQAGLVSPVMSRNSWFLAHRT